MFHIVSLGSNQVLRDLQDLIDVFYDNGSSKKSKIVQIN